MRERRIKRDMIKFAVMFLAVLIVFLIGVIRVGRYNHIVHHDTVSGEQLFSDALGSDKDCTVNAIPRGSTWSKVFDFNDEGLTEHNYRAYTYDFPVRNNTADEISDFKFRLTFDKEVFLLSAWNGALELHQNANGGEYVAVVPDLRDFHPEDFTFDTVTFDGETLIRMNAGDYLNYIPNRTENAMEVPLEPFEGTVPGIILYAPIGEEINGWVLELQYQFHRQLTRDAFFWIAAVVFLLWIIGLVIYIITSSQIKKYNLRHERDNELIRESIETFTGFIDAKDPYTKGHSSRVAAYTKAIAEEMGFSGEELDRIYYVALLHDCGKIGVPDNILKKPDRLTDEEFEVIKSHTVRGGEILGMFKSLKDVGEGALYHHERYDGRGYPEGKAGEDIPLIARMICVADSFDAMNSNRVYRNKLTPEKIMEEIDKNKGKQFDPDIAEVFLKLLKDGKVSVADRERFAAAQE